MDADGFDGGNSKSGSVCIGFSLSDCDGLVSVGPIAL